MNQPVIATGARRFATVVALLNSALLIAGAALSLRYGELLGPTEWLLGTFFALDAVAYNVLAVLIVSRARNRLMGWLFLIVGASAAGWLLGAGLLAAATARSVTDSVILGWVNWLQEVIYIPMLILPVTLVLLYFPDGRLPSPRWRIALAMVLYGLLGWVGAIGFAPWPSVAVEFDGRNPLAIPGSERIFELLFTTAAPIMSLGVLASLLAVLVRFRRARGVERQQMKWLVYTAAVVITTLALLIAFNPEDDLFGTLIGVVTISIPGLFALAIGIAILRYRLFDIDLIIRRTLQYGLLTGILALVYFGLVLVSQNLLGLIGVQQNNILVVISTLIVAALFNPLRRRTQRAIDRRFYRQKYEADRALAAFAATARDEVDLDQLTGALVDILDQTVQPSLLNLILLGESDRR